MEGVDTRTNFDITFHLYRVQSFATQSTWEGLGV
jgi:hypothetical protein